MKSKSRLVWTAILFLMLTAMPMFGTVSAATNGQSLTVGSWVTVKGSYRHSSTGSGSDEGTRTETGEYSMKVVVTAKDSDTITLSRQEDGQWSCTATGNWGCGKGARVPASGTWSRTYEYTIALNSLMVIAVGKDTNKNLIGHPTWLLVNVGQLTEGDKATIGWWVPNSDAKGDKYSDVNANVGTQTVNIKGIQMKVWGLTYSGDALGWWKNSDGVYSRGPATETSLYDIVYGILVGDSYKHTAKGVEVGGVGAWTEDYSDNVMLVDTSLSFTVPVTLNIEPRTGVAMTVDGTRYSADQFPTKLDWAIGTTHTLQVDAAVQGPTGVQYVFLQWSDGSKDTSRSLTVTQKTSLTATFKTQYKLTVTSDLGNPQGSGWYDANTQATFSVTTALAVEGFMGTLGGKYVFDRWTGDSTATTATASVTMDGPKTVKAEWRTDNTVPYMIIGAIGAAVIIIVALLFLMRRRKAPAPAPAYQPPPAVTVAPPQPSPPVAPPAAQKFCMNCGAPLPLHVKFCNKCGSEQ